MEAAKIVANLKEGDSVFVVFHDRLPIPEVDNLIVISEKNWKKLQNKTTSGNKGWLLIESDLFTLINSLHVLERATTALPSNYIINVTLLEIERKQNKWYEFWK